MNLRAGQIPTLSSHLRVIVCIILGRCYWRSNKYKALTIFNISNLKVVEKGSPTATVAWITLFGKKVKN